MNPEPLVDLAREPAADDRLDWLRRAVLRDIAENLEREPRRRDIIVSLVWSRGVQALVLYRTARWCWKHHCTLLSELLTRVNQIVFGVDISYRALIGPGMVLRHPVCVVIGSGCRIGSGVRVFQGVTLGNRLSGSERRPDGMPIIGDGVLLGAGAKVLGPVTIGSGSIVGANAVVTKSFPSGSVIAGPPAYAFAPDPSPPGPGAPAV